ncbi:MAG: isopentenyl-diphosphate delta-isomerase [Bacteroidetes bacterium RIFCSPLOWO2_12_FULL_35_15]|nr:MAG: isopentenyl-diphosphate delta-isomerase [Bacteroidetes bacterium RIFCSPLOWO2_12_FULL_35_15]
MKEKKVILVDENDVPRGTMEKMEAHKKGELHRAFSIFVFNSKGELLLQRRTMDKYHSGGLWTNTCCSHPQPEEIFQESVHKRLNEEMGFSCELKSVFHFIYKAELDNGLTEHELDHVFIGYYNEDPKINIQEVAEWKYMSVPDIQQNMRLYPTLYTAWFKIILARVLKYI